MPPYRLAYTILLILLSAKCNALEMGVASSQVAPVASIYYDSNGPKLRPEGILYELGQYAENYTSEKIRYKVIPRGDVDTLLSNGQLQSVCYTRAEWHPNLDNILLTDAFMQDKEILVSIKPHIPKIQKYNDLNGMVIGLMEHYQYPRFLHLIDSKAVIPVYHKREIYNIIGLFRDKKVDVILIKERTLKHLLEVIPDIVGKERLYSHPLSTNLLIHCAVSKHHKKQLPVLNKAIQAYTQDHPL